MNKLPYETITRNVLVKKEAATDEKYGCIPEHRSTEEIIQYGIINVNKPRGPTSHEVSAFVQRILHINKSGHSGTLDPKVTGCLPIALGRATKIVQALLLTGKEYVTVMHLHTKVDSHAIHTACHEFVGKIRQLPPLKSSVKRVMRTREIYYIEILEIYDQDVLFRVGCEAGTYIRKLCHDIGLKLGIGAHMAELIRTRVGPFSTDTYFSLQDITDAFYYWNTKKQDEKLRKIIQPVEHAIVHLPKIWVFDSAINSLCHGHSLAVPGISKYESEIKKNDIVAVLSLKHELICLGSAQMSSEEMSSPKGIAVKTDRVFMLPETYPRLD